MSFAYQCCSACGTKINKYRNPVPTVDIIIELPEGIILIERKNEPLGWALPGGFVDYGETLEDAAKREAKEETSLDVSDLRLLGCYSDPSRDPRQHTITTVYVAKGSGRPVAADDAASLNIFPYNHIPENLCFDHAKILTDYQNKKNSGLI